MPPTHLTKIHTTEAPQAIGPYSQGIRLSGSLESLLFVSGQVPLDPQTSQLSSKNDVISQTHQVMKNLGAVLKEGHSSFDHVVKTTIYLTDMAYFSDVNQVYQEYFKEPYPARVTVAVKELPCSALVEIDALAIKSS